MDDGPDFEWDEAKAARNLAERGIGFEAIRAFDWETCRTREDTRGAYGERRLSPSGSSTGGCMSPSGPRGPGGGA